MAQIVSVDKYKKKKTKMSCVVVFEIGLETGLRIAF